jgi:hypothetical protein
MTPLSGSDDPDAAQTQRRPPSPHPQDVVQGAELAGLRVRDIEDEVLTRPGRYKQVADNL